MASQVSTGQASLTLDTPVTLDTITAAGSYVLDLDLSPLADGDVLVVTVETKVRTGSTRRVTGRVVYANDQSGNVQSYPFASLHEIAFILEQTDGTGRSIDWTIIQVDA